MTIMRRCLRSSELRAWGMAGSRRWVLGTNLLSSNMRVLGRSWENSADSMPRKPAKGQQKRQREALSWAGDRACLTQRGILAVTLGDLPNPMVGTLGGGRAMEPENVKPDAAESRVGEPKAVDPKAGEPTGADPKIAHPETAEPNSEHSKLVQTKIVPTKIVPTRINERKFARVSRRELLKVAPILALGAFAIPRFQESVLKKGLEFSDWASARLFRRSHLAPTFANAEVTPLEKFPINGYDVDDPGVIFENWTLTVGGAVQKPGDYKLAQIQALPRFRQNTRHVCVEGWDVIGRFGGARLADSPARRPALRGATPRYFRHNMPTAVITTVSPLLGR